jgi:outer membrane protein W
MRFQKHIAIVAITTLATFANAQDGSQGVVIMNSNTNTSSSSATADAAAAASQQPNTVVEAQPISASKAELMRKARQNEEVNTEQKIVEKLEESRLKEEQQRAERLFGNKLDPQPQAVGGAAATATAVSNTSGAAATATAVTVEPKKEEEVKATHVNIEKVEIIQPAQEVKAYEPAPIAAAPAVSKIEVQDEKEEAFQKKFFVSGILAAPNYDASNVKSNYGLGVSVGSFVSPNWAVEGTFLYSNHTVDTYWKYGLYEDLDQYDFSAAAKYYILTDRIFMPYLGGQVSYIYRKYSERIRQGTYWVQNPETDQEETHAVNAGLGAGVDFKVSDNILIGGAFEYNFNLMTKNDFDYTSYGVKPEDTKPLEEIDYMLLKISAKMTF